MKFVALTIGLNDYPGTNMDLSGCVSDAMDWSQSLNSSGYRLHSLVDNEATGEAIRGELRKLIRDARSGDTVLFQYSGHGSYVLDVGGEEADGFDECICPHDVMANGVITDDELNEILGDRAQGIKVICIMDSCHSGTVTRFANSTDPLAQQSRVRFMPPSVFDEEMVNTAYRRGGKSPGRRFASLLLSACQDHEYAYDAWFDGRPNGAFTRAALDALKTDPAPLTYADWYKLIRNRLPSQRYPQTPRLMGTTQRRLWPIFK